MSSPVRSVAVRLSMDPSSYIAGATRAERSTLALDKAVSNVGPHTATSMERAAAGAGRAEGAFGKAQKSAGAFGLTLGGLAGAGAAVAVGLSVKWAGDYQSALTRLNTTAGESTKNLAMVGRGMLDMAGQVGIGADELAKGMYTIDSAGIHGADSLIVLKAAAQGARQEQADLGHVVDAVTTSLHDYHLPASDAAKVTSQLIAAVSNGKTTFDELTAAMHSVEPIAASAGMSIAQTAGALAAMTASGMHADQAAQNLASSIRSFEKPTSTMRDELYQLGLDAQDLSAHLGQRGIAGTLQLVSDAIVRKMGPAGQVALDSLNKNKAAAQDLVVMMQAMPPALAKASSGLLDGSVSIKDYRTAAKDMGGTQAAMALQFLSLYSSSKGFSSILKTGGPAVQTYLAALGKGVGTAEGLSVALQLTGENAGGANKAIHAVATAAAQADGSIRGWDEVQHNFNQRLAEAEAGAKSLAIEAGQHLLPILTDVLGYVHDHGPAALHALGTGFDAAATAAKPLIEVGGGVVKVFQSLPGPMQETVVGLIALRGAAAMGWLNGLGTGAGKVGAAFRNFGADVSATRGVLEQARVPMAGFTSTLMTTAERGMGGLKAAGSGVMNMLGGPWGAAFAGGAIGVSLLQAATEKAKATEDRWTDAMKQGGAALSAANAEMTAQTQKLDAYSSTITGKVVTSHNGWVQSLRALLPGMAMSSQIIDGTTASAQKSKTAFDTWYNSLAGAAKAQEDVTLATGAYNEAAQKSGPESLAARDAADKLRVANSMLATAQDQENNAQQTHLDLLKQQKDADLAAVNSQLAAQIAQDNLTTAIDRYNYNAKLGSKYTGNLKDDSLQLAQQVYQTAQQTAQAAADQAKANGVTDTSVVYNNTLHDALDKNAKLMSGPGQAAVAKMTGVTAKMTVEHGKLDDAITKLGLNVVRTWDGNTQEISGATDAQKKMLKDLGLKIVNLPGMPGHPANILVTASTGPADKTLSDFALRAQKMGFVGAIWNLTPLAPPNNGNRPKSSGLIGFPPVPKATGGAIRGPGSGTSDSVLIAASNGEHMWTAAETSAAGGHAGVEALRKAVLAGGGGRAAGGPVVNYPVDWNAAAMKQANDYLTQAAASVGPPGAGAERLRPIVDRVLTMLGQPTSYANGVLAMIQAESGGNSTIVNRSDSNWAAGHPSVGDMQVIAGTFARYAGPYLNTGPFSYGVSTNDTANIYAGTNYALQRYGPGILASGGRHSAPGHYIGYKTGTDFVPADGPAYLHRGERVVTAEDNAAIRSREVAGGAGGAVIIHKTDARSYPISVEAAYDGERILRAVRDSQRENEFLHG